MNITNTFTQNFAKEWVESWNSHNIEKILSHYTDDFIIQTPLAAKMMPETSGVVSGKEAVRAYWTQALEMTPNLEFEILEVFAGVSGLTICYHNKARNIQAVEVMFFNDELKVKQAIVHHKIDVEK